MSKARGVALLGLVDSDDEVVDVLAEDTVVGAKMAPAKKTRAAANKTTKSTQNAASRTGGKSTAAATKGPGRKALADKQTNVQEKPTRGKGNKRPATEEAEEDEEEDEISITSDTKPKGGRGRPRAAKVQKISEEEEPSITDQSETAARPATKRGRKPRTKVDEAPAEPEIPETQPVEKEIPETQAIEITELSIEEYEQIGDLPSYNRARSSSVQRLQPHGLFSATRRTVPASDSELHEPLMRRKVGDLTRKYESLEAKYRDLREIGVKEAERNFDRLKKQTEEKANTTNELIATLKAQLSTQTELAKESQRLKQQLEASQAKVDELQDKVNDTNASLVGAKTEIKTLNTKLSAARSAETANPKIPGSAIKGSNANKGLLANAEAAAQTAQMKEVLYGDLTGLIVRGVKREQNGADTYDCIQTGRNGTLHFKLGVGGDELMENDEPQFIYMPQLDPSRDQDLIDMLPDYLVEEITFPQSHAARFYSRVMRSLTERPE
ncbi:chromosome segregation protein Csm1/Pcs1-domain-containing protein [Hypoxylon trugodes]|uniref:chromosome segregation protein Csm1/Pcs1-domain-containing protein n=1 Tax=Hypoxylon trugodes TaxID=326681 RepID=UPI00218EDCDE|nr:chromosome segregation protein Csm1/Pcs1-domain-containing protein [Hypoxylon trugodes]KAI1386282.1 chromosome segregation protein Csm1/Pcs1-domain-containing protein [Hypoxylon trugodes]